MGDGAIATIVIVLLGVLFALVALWEGKKVPESDEVNNTTTQNVPTSACPDVQIPACPTPEQIQAELTVKRRYASGNTSTR